MTNAHTPGPWRVHALGCVVDASDRTIPYYSGLIEGAYSGSDATEESEANARLIAAAPDMAAELEWLAAYAEARAMDDDAEFARVGRGALMSIAERARAATAKAEAA